LKEIFSNDIFAYYDDENGKRIRKLIKYKFNDNGIEMNGDMYMEGNLEKYHKVFIFDK
jgi:hypothetical protein